MPSGAVVFVGISEGGFWGFWRRFLGVLDVGRIGEVGCSWWWFWFGSAKKAGFVARLFCGGENKEWCYFSFKR